MEYHFKISPPFCVDLSKARKYYRTPKTAANQSFWLEGEDGFEYRYKRGVYIFFIGSTPIYVGKAVGKDGFYQECFQKEKLEKLSDFFKNDVDYMRNHFKRMFIYAEMKKTEIAGKEFCRYVKEMESYLIKLANRKNPDCKNDKETKEHWIIEGFYPYHKRNKSNVDILDKILFPKTESKNR